MPALARQSESSSVLVFETEIRHWLTNSRLDLRFGITALGPGHARANEAYSDDQQQLMHESWIRGAEKGYRILGRSQGGPAGGRRPALRCGLVQ
jgi:hypothetical protein